MSLDAREIAVVKGMLARGDRQHDIAAYFGVNAGRISEIGSGQTGSQVKAAAASQLPPAGPVMAGRSALHARDTLQSIRDRIDAALAEIDRFERGDK